MTENRQLPSVLEHDFIITDESVNRYGWRLLVAGIDLAGFLIPVGKWKNLRIDGGEFKGTVEFDRNDPDAIKLYWKYTDGYMNAVSIHVVPLEENGDPAALLPGQTRPTVTKCELIEISLVTVPGQKNAVKLSTPDGNEYKLKDVGTLIPSGQPEQEARNLILSYVNQGVNVSETEYSHMLSLAKRNPDFVKNLLEKRKANRMI